MVRETKEGGRKETRTSRDPFVLTALVFVAVGLAIALWPILAQVGPDAGAPGPAYTEVELASIEPGKALAAAWEGKPVIVRRRTSREIEQARVVPQAALRDRLARNETLAPEAPAIDANRAVKDRPEWLVVIGVNPQSRCILRIVEPDPASSDDIAFVCPCDGSRFDTAGRIRGGPARTNLIVPKHRLISAMRLRLG